MQLEPFLVSELFAFLMIFVRIGSGIMFVPGLAEAYVPVRIRLLFALTCALAIMPAVQPLLPAVPGSPLTLAVLIGMEIIIGTFLGLLSRVIISVMHIAGMVISYQSSLASATMFDMTQATQGTAIGNFLSLTALVAMFATNMHHLMLQGLFDSYTLFPAGLSAPVDDMSNHYTRIVADAFVMAMKLSAPMLVVGMVSFTGMGVLARLMPNMQVFFIIVPPQIMVSFAVLLITLSGMLLWYGDFVESHLSSYLARF